MSRTRAREIALHLIYEMSFHEFPTGDSILERLEESVCQSIAGEIALYAGKLDQLYESERQSFAEEAALDTEELDRLYKSERQSLAEGIALYAEKLDQKQTEYIINTVKGVAAHADELDETIKSNSKGWSLSRITRISRAVLRLALYEMAYAEDVPVGAAINEAVELAKKYDSNEAGKFINGILGTVGRSGRTPAEAQPAAAAETKPETTAETLPESTNGPAAELTESGNE